MAMAFEWRRRWWLSTGDKYWFSSAEEAEGFAVWVEEARVAYELATAEGRPEREQAAQAACDAAWAAMAGTDEENDRRDHRRSVVGGAALVGRTDGK